MDGSVEQSLAPALGRRAVARILFDVGDHPGIENALSILCGIKAPIGIKVGASEVQSYLFSYVFQCFQALWE
jgi:hypothetical protein